MNIDLHSERQNDVSPRRLSSARVHGWPIPEQGCARHRDAAGDKSRQCRRALPFLHARGSLQRNGFSKGGNSAAPTWCRKPTFVGNRLGQTGKNIVRFSVTRWSGCDAQQRLASLDGRRKMVHERRECQRRKRTRCVSLRNKPAQIERTPPAAHAHLPVTA